MANDKELLKAFREQFNTGHLYTESQVLVLMGYARGEARKELRAPEPDTNKWSVCDACGLWDTGDCRGCTLNNH